jgi:Arc/MetJ-type ribon-helix-helix transcriptional regulator
MSYSRGFATMSLISIRLDPETDQILDGLSRRHRVSRSQLVRDAITAMAKSENQTESPFARLAPFIGCVSGGPPTLSRDTGKQLQQLLKKARHR